jgi:acetyl/propionyl-CoA carboxylase alpha subunit
MKKILIANRGEIVIRVARSCREAGFSTVAVFTEADSCSLHKDACDQALQISSYLNAGAILKAALESGADAVHPGFGFLSENAAFARAVLDAGLCWIGPKPEAIAAMGDKVEARAQAIAAGVPVVPGVESAEPEAIKALGFPVLLKAAGGGGGKGMRKVEQESDLSEAIAGAVSEAQAAFGSGKIYAEKLLLKARHVEVQLLSDTHGTCLALGDRDCSLQRRHQKILEEAPAPKLSDATRQGLHQAAIRLARAVGYSSAGTVEFLVAENGDFYFLEMNTRLQVEHTVTECILGLDLVACQLQIAQGNALTLGERSPQGHAIQVRLYAEDPASNYLPSPGIIQHFKAPEGPGIRVDTAIASGSEVSVYYDPMLAKIIAWAPDRPLAIARLRRALSETVLLGITSNLEFLQDILNDPAVADFALHTGFLENYSWAPARLSEEELALFLAASTVKNAVVSSNTPETSIWQSLGSWRVA